MKYSYYICLEGLNLDRLFKELNNKNIKLYDCNRPNYKTCEFGLSFFDYVKVSKNKLLKNFKVTVKKTHNLGYFFHTFLNNIGFYAGCLLVVVALMFVSKTTLKINLLGLENITEQEIISSLTEIGVTTGKINTKTNEEIEQYLKQVNDKISLVSVAKKGTNLIVNIKEKITKSEEVVSPICAPYNMVINSITVTQGVAQVSVGDIVKKGDVLVAPKIILTSGKATELTPMATINATVWITGNVEFNTQEVIYEKTGKKQVISNFEINGKQIFSSGTQVKFENYEKSVYNDYVFKNMFLPIKLNKTIYYETKEKVVTKNFDEYKESLILKSKELAYSKLPKNLTVQNESVNISQNGNSYYVTTYLQVNYVIEG